MAKIVASLCACLLLLVACGESHAGDERVVGHWILREIDGERVGEITLRVEFAPDGKYHVVGPCHTATGQYYLSGPRKANLQALELQSEQDCSAVGREVTRRARQAVQDCAHVGLRSGRLEFFDRAGNARLRLERDPGA